MVDPARPTLEHPRLLLEEYERAHFVVEQSTEGRPVPGQSRSQRLGCLPTVVRCGGDEGRGTTWGLTRLTVLRRGTGGGGSRWMWSTHRGVGCRNLRLYSGSQVALKNRILRTTHRRGITAALLSRPVRSVPVVSTFHREFPGEGE